jgi:cholesterol transport system auxiliary component
MTSTVAVDISARWHWLAVMYLLLASGCSILDPAASTAPVNFYALDLAGSKLAAAARPAPQGAPTLIVTPPRAAAGFGSQRIIYIRQAHQLEYFAFSEWIDTPARMLSPLILAAARNTGAFSAVVHAPTSASADLRLDTEVLQLQQEFFGEPSQVRFALRTDLVEEGSRRIIASREFVAVAPASPATPYGGVVAANQAVHSVLESLAAFCMEAAWRWQQERKPAADQRLNQN